MKSERAKPLEDVQKRIRALSSRDLQLWSISLLMVLVLALGFAALVTPGLLWANQSMIVGTRHLPQLLFGFLILITLFNLYLIIQRHELNDSRQELILELMFDQRIQNGSVIDPLTQLFNRRYLDHAIPHEVALANRHDAPLTVLIVDLDGFRQVNSRFGHAAGDELLTETARVLSGIFGATDTLLRYGGDEFLALLPECPIQQAQERVQHALGQARLWNETAGKDYQMAFSYGLSEYRQGRDIKGVLAEAERDLQRRSRQTGAEGVRALRTECLIASDDTEAVRVLRSMMEPLSVEVEVCADAEAVYQILKERRFEAIMADTELPGLMESLARVRTLNTAQNLIVVALRGPVACAGFGASFVLEKPLVASSVARSVRVIHAMMLAERQRYFRHPISAPVLLRFDGNPEYAGTATDLSEGGMAVRCAQSLQAGRTGMVSFELPEESTRIEARVRVAWADGEGRAGLRFVAMRPSVRAALRHWRHSRSEIVESPRSPVAESGTKLGMKAAG